MDAENLSCQAFLPYVFSSRKRRLGSLGTDVAGMEQNSGCCLAVGKKYANLKYRDERNEGDEACGTTQGLGQSPEGSCTRHKMRGL